MGGDLDPKQTEFLAQHVYKVKEVLFFRLDQGAVGAEDVEDHAHPCHDMCAILTAGTIYYSGSPAFDLTSRLIKRFEDLNTRVGACEPGARRSGPPYDTFEAPHGGHPFDVRFLWNSNILQPLYTIREKFSPHENTAFDLHGFCVPVIQGFFAFKRIGDAELTVVSRRGWQGAGTRFNRRGVDSQGHVGNFAETETILTTPTESCSFVQVRGSVPCYWKEVIGAGFGALKTSVRVKLPVSDSYPAFQTHFRRLCTHYGDTVYGLNLLSASVQKEIALADAYHHLHQLAVHQDGILWDALKLIDFDMKTRGAIEGLANMPHELADLVEDFLPDIGSSIITRGKGGEWVTATSKQKGIVRVNCRDCLDRTNLAQNVISWKALEMYLTTRKACCKSIDMQQLERRHQAMLARNGDALSEIYAGSAAMTSEVSIAPEARSFKRRSRQQDGTVR